MVSDHKEAPPERGQLMGLLRRQMRNSFAPCFSRAQGPENLGLFLVVNDGGRGHRRMSGEKWCLHPARRAEMAPTRPQAAHAQAGRATPLI